MATPKIFESEYRFCLILWRQEPINSTKLAQICKEELGWSRTTTYTVIKRLSDRGVVKNENAVVTALVTREEAESSEPTSLPERLKSASLSLWRSSPITSAPDKSSGIMKCIRERCCTLPWKTTFSGFRGVCS